MRGELAGVIVEDGFRCPGRRGVREDDRRHVLPERRCYSGQFLGQRPNADAHMPDRKGEIHQLACTPFHVFGGRAVVEDYERLGAHEKPPHKLQPFFHVVLLANYHIHSWIVFTNSVVGLVVRECWADENDVVELEAGRAVDLVHHKP